MRSDGACPDAGVVERFVAKSREDEIPDADYEVWITRSCLDVSDKLADVRSGVSGPAYRPPDSLAQLVAETLPKGEEDSLKVVRRLGCLSCQLQRHAFQAYNPLVQKATALYDVLQYGAPQPFVAPRTAPADAVPPEPNPTSNLIRLAYDADSLELPPQIFW